MAKKTVKDVELKGKRVLMRADFNVPLDGGTITDNSRIVAALPTIKYILEQEPQSLVLMTHVGRPKSADDPDFSTKPIADELSNLLDQAVIHVNGVVGDAVQQAVEGAAVGSVLILENTRYEAGEKKNDADLSARLAELGELYVNDAFGTAHRAHASTEGVAQAIRAKGGAAVAGFLIGKELDALGAAVENPEHPYIAIMGGAKISDKIQLIDNILQKADKVLIGGGMANTFLAAQGHSMGKSLVEQDAIPEAKRLMEQFGERLVLPVDVAIADEFSDAAKGDLRKVDKIPHDKMALDIGPGTMELFEEVLEDAALVIWNGPMGVFEFENFSQGTFGIAHILADAVENGATVIIGGGDSAAAVREAGLSDQMSHVSTGGGASLELLEGKTLPGIAALDDK